jgi:hypothetical protein
MKISTTIKSPSMLLRKHQNKTPDASMTNAMRKHPKGNEK